MVDECVFLTVYVFSFSVFLLVGRQTDEDMVSGERDRDGGEMVRLQDGETGYWIHVGETGYMYPDRIGWACIMHSSMASCMGRGGGARRRRRQGRSLLK